jgi:ADP-ribose pyrophosphatase
LNDDTQVLAAGKFLRLLKRGRWEFADRVNSTGAVVIVAVTDERRIVLTEQYRLPLGKRVVELPAGLTGDEPGAADEDFAVAARRELLEETGYDCRDVEWLTSGPTSGGLSTEIVAFYRAVGLTRLTAGGGTEHEEIEVHEVHVDEALAWLARKHDDGILIDPKVYAGLYFAGHRYPE